MATRDGEDFVRGLAGLATVAAGVVLLTAGCTSDTSEAGPPGSSAAPSATTGGVLHDPDEVELPPTVDGTGAWLRGDGSVVVTALRVSDPLATLDERLTDDERPDDVASICADTAAALDEVVAPQRLFALANSTPDHEGAVLLSNDLAAKRDLLVACGSGSATAEDALLEAAEEVHFTHRVAVRWVEQYGVTVGG